MERIKKAWNRGVEYWREQFQEIEDIRSGAIPDPRTQLAFGLKQPKGFEKIFLIVLQFFRCLSLSNIIGFFSAEKEKRSTYIEKYVIAWSCLLILLLVLHPLSTLFYFIVGIVLVLGLLILFIFVCPRTWYFIVGIVWFLGLLIVGFVFWKHPSLYIVLIFGYLLSDILSANLGIIFIDRYKGGGIRSLNRSLLLIGINYFEIIVAFAILYLATFSIGYTNCSNILTSPIDALYFSAVTITSLGCYDMKPISLCGRVLVALEPIIGLILIVIVIGAFFTFYARK